MAVKNMIAGLGIVAMLAGAGGGLNGAPANKNSGLDQIAMQETTQPTQQQEVQVDQQKYDEIKKLFDDNDAVARGVMEKVAIEYNSQYKIYTTFYFKSVNIYKHKKNDYTDEYTKNFREGIGSKRWGKYDKVIDEFIELSMPAVYLGIKPGTNVPEPVKKAAERAGVKEPTIDEKTPEINLGEDVLLLMENNKADSNARMILKGYVPMNDPAYLNAFKKVLKDKNITDNYVKK